MSDELDFSDEGLGLDPPAEEVTPQAEAPAEPEPQAEPSEEDPLYWKKQFEEIDKLRGKQGAELRELREQMEEIRQQQQYEEPHHQMPELSELQQAVVTDPNGTFAWALEALNSGLIDDDVVEWIIDEVSDMDERLARRMSRQLDRHVFGNMQEQATAPLHEDMVERTIHSAALSVREENPEVAALYADDAETILNENPWLFGTGSAQDVQNGIRQALQMAVGRDPQRYIQAQQNRIQHSDQRKMAADVSTGGAPVQEGQVNESHDVLANLLATEKGRYV